MKLNGIEMVDGTKEGFDVESLNNNNNKLYFVRTDEDREDGFIVMNGKKYGTANNIDCGEY